MKREADMDCCDRLRKLELNAFGCSDITGNELTTGYDYGRPTELNPHPWYDFKEYIKGDR